MAVIRADQAPYSSFLKEFRDPDLEQEFQKEFLPFHSQQIYRMLVLVLLPGTLFVVNDILLIASGSSLWSLITMRTVWVIATFITAMAIHRATSHQYMICVAVAYCLLCNGFILYVDYSRPQDYLGHIGLDVASIFVIYFMIAIPLRHQCFPAILFSVLLLAIHFGYKEPAYTLSHTSVPISIIIANVIGIMGSRQIGLMRRGEYLQKRELKHALDNVEKLSGLLPVCSVCRKVRDDNGYWQQMESFLNETSDIDFSHGICPNCANEYYEEQKT